MALPIEAIAEKFWEKVRKTDGCWIWTGSRTDKGYGHLQIGKRHVGAHRAVLWLATGVEPTQFVLHHCDNPPCVNPAHLYEGTHADNMRDKYVRGRAGSSRGEDNPKCKLLDFEVREIVGRIIVGEGNSKIAADYGVSRSLVHALRTGRVRKHLNVAPEPQVPRVGVGRLRGSDHGMAKLAEKDVLAIRAKYAAGESWVSISKQFPVSYESVRFICLRKNWKHLP